MFCFNNPFWRPCCQNTCPPPTPTPCPPPRPCCPQACPCTTLGAQFGVTVAQTVASGATIPLTTTVFNNATQYVTNDNGVITLNDPGIYLVKFYVVANNANATVANASISFEVNGVAQPSISSIQTIAANGFGTLVGETIVSVPFGSPSTANMIITTDQPLALTPNVVVLKL